MQDLEDIHTYDACTVANWFIARARQDDRELTIMAILKLIYIAHGWHLEMYNRPLFRNRIEAWRFGPVVEDVYDSFRNQRDKISKEVSIQGDRKIGDRQNKFLESVYGVYGDMDAYRLSDLTHVKDGPWDIVIRAYGRYAKIPDALIRLHYQLKRSEGEKQENEQE